MPWGVVAGAVIGAVGSGIASSNAADAQKDAANTASNTQLQMYNTTRADQAPWRQAGGQAVNALSQWYGLGGVTTPSSTDSNAYDPTSGYSVGPYGSVRQLIPQSSGAASATSQATPDFNKILSNLPGYQFQMQQGTQAVQRNLAAQGLLQSGAAGKALEQYGQGLASNYATQYVNGLQSLAGLGQTSAANTGALGANAANQIGANQIYAGNAQASSYAAQGNAINSGLSGLVGAYGMYQQRAGNPYAAGSYDSVMGNGDFGGPNSYGSGYTFDDYGATP